ncbi:hypothetical protein ACFLQY_04855 [Verrucomicrobiota bacterium]
MTTFNINLSRGHILSFQVRQWIYRLFLTYIFVCGIFLVVVCNRAVYNLVDAHQQEKRIEKLQGKFEQNQATTSEIREYYDSLYKKLQQQAEQIKLIDENMPTQVHIAPLLVELIEPLPPGLSIQEAKYTPSDNLLQFNVIIPQQSTNDQLSSEKLILQWKRRPLIRELTSSLTATLSDRAVINDREVYIVQFRCVLKERG